MKEFDKLKKRMKHFGKSKNPFIKFGMKDLQLLVSEIDNKIAMQQNEITKMEKLLSVPAPTPAPITVKVDGGDF